MPSGVMQGNIANVRHWAEQVEIDWFTHFIKAWIPFNAWYQNAFEEDGDRRVLNALKSGADNPLRAAAVRLLVREDEDALSFKNQLAQLHTRLEEREMLNPGRRITFTDCFIGENPTTQITSERGFNGALFTLERGVGRAVDPSNPNNKKKIACEITARNKQQLFLLQHRFDEDDLRAQPSFSSLRLEWQSDLLARYRRVSPNLMVNLTDAAHSEIPVGLTPAQQARRSGDGSAPFNMIAVGPYFFCHNPGFIFSGLLEVLYALRCLLFHGEIVPTSDHNKVYEPAYFLLRRFLTCIT